MYKVGICGHFALGMEFANGQVDKTKAVYAALAKAYGKEKVAILDTRNWQKRPVSFVLQCRKLVKECENVIMMPSQTGFKIFPFVFEQLNRSCGRRLHYVVTGGWLADKLNAQPAFIKPIAALDKVYVELEPMKTALEKLGLDNVLYLPNFRQTNALSPDELVYGSALPLRVCTFSRITPEKGIEQAVEAVRAANKLLGATAYILDIYGDIQPEDEEWFSRLSEGFEDYINYAGYVKAQDRTAVLKNYFALLFPTVYAGEGFPGTVVDAFAAGLPVIATDWLYNGSIIRNGTDGLLYDPKETRQLTEILVKAAENPQSMNAMKPACLERTAHFEADRAIVTLLNELGEKREKSMV